MIYLIGGSIRTGKSSLAHKILQNKKISVISTDVIIGLLMDYVKPQDPSDLRPYFVKKAENFFPHLKKLMQANLNMGIKDYVYEGDIILPEYVAALREELELKACFLGFSDINVDLLKEHAGNHQWLDELSEEKLDELPKRIIDTSKYMEEGCKKYGFRYFDLSIDYDQEHELAYRYLLLH